MRRFQVSLRETLVAIWPGAFFVAALLVWTLASNGAIQAVALLAAAAAAVIDYSRESPQG